MVSVSFLKSNLALIALNERNPVKKGNSSSIPSNFILKLTDLLHPAILHGNCMWTANRVFIGRTWKPKWCSFRQAASSSISLILRFFRRESSVRFPTFEANTLESTITDGFTAWWSYFSNMHKSSSPDGSFLFRNAFCGYTFRDFERGLVLIRVVHVVLL